MRLAQWHWMEGLGKLLAPPRPEPARQAQRIVATHLHIVLPIRIAVALLVFYHLLYSPWRFGAASIQLVVVETLLKYFGVYLLCNALVTAAFLFRRRFPLAIFQWLVFTLGLLDGLLMAGLTLITLPGGFESMVFWVFPGLIVLNAISIPLATAQIALNLMLCTFYLSAGLLYLNIDDLNNPKLPSLPTLPHLSAPKTPPQPTYGAGEEPSTEPYVLRFSVLLLLTACCYGVQVLAERQRQAVEEEQEFAVREGQLQSAGRLAAEIAHQLKNPLGIINNAIFSLQRALKEGKPVPEGQVEMIQEEIERADRIITDLMGYAQLVEGHVEPLNVTEEIQRALEQVFPLASTDGVQVECRLNPRLPTLLMQRRHFSGVLVNILQNAREALGGHGKVWITASRQPDDSVEVIIGDNGPGIPAEKLDRIFDPYFTTKEKGTGIGLAIVKHNVELYAGTVRAESELGKGCRFILLFPAKTVMSTGKQN